MKNVLLMVAIIGCFSLHATAQTTKALSKVLELKLLDKAGGANGASVAWHSIQKKYYTAIAGNTSFPLAVFDEKGKQLSDTFVTTMFDVRGLWYNSLQGKLQANGYADNGWIEYTLDSKGIPTSKQQLFFNKNQMDDNAVGAYDTRKNLVYFFTYYEGMLAQYNMKEATRDTLIDIYLGSKKGDLLPLDNADVLADYNSTTAIYTGVAAGEIGVLNVYKKQIELYGLIDHYLNYILTLPDDAPINDMFNFSYCNGIYWLFDKANRVWKGYK